MKTSSISTSLRRPLLAVGALTLAAAATVVESTHLAFGRLGYHRQREADGRR